MAKMSKLQKTSSTATHARAIAQNPTSDVLSKSMGRTEIAGYSDPNGAFARACDTSVKLRNLMYRLETVHSALYGDRLSGNDASAGKDIGTGGFFSLLREETDKHAATLEELDDVLNSIEHRTGLVEIDRTPFNVVDLPAKSVMAATTRPERNL